VVKRETSEAAPGAAPVTTSGEARALVRSAVGERWESPSRRAHEQDVVDLLLVVSELAANAVRHGGGLDGVDVHVSDEGVRVAVHDHSDVVPEAAHRPEALPVPHTSAGGYGWPLIHRLGREVRVTRRPRGGKTISVLVPLRAVPVDAGAPES
jgi:anti-sigma regulatory factor (Ser/Thr protein kinase)